MTDRRRVLILDTTLRDGEQTEGVSFSPAEKLNIAKALLRQLRVDRIEVASARISQGEREAVANIMVWANEHGFGRQVEVLGFVDHTRSVDWIRGANGHVLNLLTKGSLKHCREQLRKTLEEHLADIRQTLDYAHEHGLAVNVYLEDWSNGYRDSRDYVYGLMDGLQGLGIGHFMLPDTLGVLTPDEVWESIGDMVRRYPHCRFDFHPHNDYGLGTANALMAVKAGAACVHSTVNCLGERAGNASLAEVVVNLRDRLDVEIGIDEAHIVRLSRMVENFSGKRVADNAPIVGLDVFTQTSGIHADGDKKGGLYQTALTPDRFARERSYALGKMSGKASLQKNLERLDITLSGDNFDKVLARVVALGDSKKHISSEDLPFIIAEVLERKEYNHIELKEAVVTSALNLESTASIRVRVGKDLVTATGFGNGGFDAFMKAITQIMSRKRVRLPQLADYEVRIPRGGNTDALTECTITWEAEDGHRFNTRGVDSNQVLAAMYAAIRMLNVLLHKQRGKGEAEGEGGTAV